MRTILIASIATSLAAAALAAVQSDIVPLVPSWDEAPDEFKKGIDAQVQAYAKDPSLTPEVVYANWLKIKTDEGWTFGEAFNAEAKQSPSIVPWEQVAVHRRMVETMVHAATRELKDLPDAAADGLRAPAEVIMATPDGFVPIKYIGHRETYKDGAYNTGIVFTKGGTQLVPAGPAALMLRHPDVYAPGEVRVAAPAQTDAKPSAQESEEERLQDVRDSIARMTKAACKEFAKTHFRLDIEDAKVDEMRAAVVQLVDQFGVSA